MTLVDIVTHNDLKFLHIHYSFDGCNNSDHGYITWKVWSSCLSTATNSC